LAFKSPEKEVERLIHDGKALPLKNFPKGKIKSDYVLFDKPELTQLKRWKKYFNDAVTYAIR
jgi:hypothetical protein